MLNITKIINIIVIVFILILPAGLFAKDVLDVPETTQEYDEWCWAGISWSILQYYLNDVEQCEIAEFTRTHATFHDFGSVDCCVDATECNYWNYNYGHDGSVEDILENWGVENYGQSSELSESEVQEEINAGHPFMIRWGYTSGSGGHFVVGHGIVGKNLYYADPWYGEGLKIADYDWVVSNSEKEWTHTNVVTTDPITRPGAAFVYAQELFEVNFTDESTCDECTIVSREWVFGDGSTSTEKNPYHVYQSFGTYTVTLTVTDSEGDSSEPYSVKITAAEASQGKDDFVGSFSSLGVFVKSSDTSVWAQLSPDEAVQISVGDIDGSGIDDLVGLWDFGLSVRYDSGSWKNLMSNTDFVSLTAGDLNGDGMDDIVGSWTDGVWWLDAATDSWEKLVESSVNMVASGDIDGNGREDLLGVWDTGVWVKYNENDQWEEIIETADLVEVTTGDLDGNGIDEVIGSWLSGVWAYDVVGDNWTELLSLPLDHVASGDLDGDSLDDLIGVYAGAATYVKYSGTGSPGMIIDKGATSITVGKMGSQ